ncbi:MAG: SDR family NAD(P)-dependent oxidoreductase [Comamonadaceae bacterium]|nr:MAG: SDR family NAD(P)-dependent oxidoreductase [Comamonadaceae bacterium]
MTRYKLEDKVVLITGAGRGIGAATATTLAERGAHVVVLDIDGDAAGETAADLPHGGGLAIEADVTDPTAMRAAVEHVVETYGRLDVVVANAGILGPPSTFRAATRE